MEQRINTNPLLNKKIFLFITEFLSGIAVMGVETAASRLLAPYFSSSQVVWTLIIGTILIAMSLGNFLGGRMADKHPDVTRLYVLILFSGAYICLIPFVGRYVIAFISALFALFATNGLIVWSSLVCCLILFVPPLMILGMVTPSLIKYTMGNSITSGKIVGGLEALNTVGSIIGTFIPTFITIPTIGTQLTFAVFGGLLVLIALVFLITGGIHTVKENKKEENEEKEPSHILKKGLLTFIPTAFATLGVVLSFHSPFVFWEDKTIKREFESIYNYLQVKEDDRSIYFSTNVMFSVESMVRKDGSLTSMYYDYCLSAPYMANIPSKGKGKVLVLGNGTGAYASLLRRYVPYPLEITGVEIDQAINDLATSTFGLSKEVELITDDGRNFLNHSKEKYDVIMVDAYSSISVPFQMASVEFFTQVKDHLVDDGVMVMNINMAGEKDNSIDIALSDTVYSAFSQVYKYRVPYQTNDELFASNNPEFLENFYQEIPNVEDVELKNTFEKVKEVIHPHKDTGIRMSDDNADVELRSMFAVDDIVSGQLAFYRQIYEERGFMGLLEYLLS